MNYQEEQALDHYITTHFRDLMTPLEQLIASALKDESHRKPVLNTYWGSFTSPKIDRALAQGREDFLHQVRKRILTQHTVLIRRCLRCQKITRTPKSKQCAWCHHRWHGLNRSH